MTAPPAPSSDPGLTDRAALIGVMLMIVVGVINAADAVIVRLLAHEVHPFVIGLTRTSFGLLAMSPWILSRPGMLVSKFRLLHVLRAALKLASLIAVFFALAEARLADVTAIGFAAPLFVTIGAWFLFGESPRPVRILAVGLGFVGVMVVLRPDWSGGLVVSPALLLALLGAALTAVIQLMLKSMARQDRTDTLVAWNLIVSVPLAALPAFLVWQNPTPFHWALLAVQGAMGAFNQTLVTRAFQLADASLVAPIDFLRLPFVAILAFVLFSEVAGLSTWVGAAVIFVATMMMAATRRGRPTEPPAA